MKIKFLCAVAALAVAGAAQAAYADAPAPAPEFTITGSAAVVSSYRFRGVAQTDNRPTGQMSLTVTDASGFYVSTWASGNTFSGGSEIDVYGGYSKTIAGFTLDGGAYGYLYPNASDYDTYEFYADVSKSYGPVTAKVGVNWAPKQHVFSYMGSASHTNWYEYAELSYTPAALPALTLHSHIGHTGGGFDVSRDYIDYTVGAGYKYKMLTFDISLVGTDLSHAAAAAATPSYLTTGYSQVKPMPVFSLTASF